VVGITIRRAHGHDLSHRETRFIGSIAPPSSRCPTSSRSEPSNVAAHPRRPHGTRNRWPGHGGALLSRSSFSGACFRRPPTSKTTHTHRQPPPCPPSALSHPRQGARAVFSNGTRNMASFWARGSSDSIARGYRRLHRSSTRPSFHSASRGGGRQQTNATLVVEAPMAGNSLPCVEADSLVAHNGPREMPRASALLRRELTAPIPRSGLAFGPIRDGDAAWADQGTEQ